MMLACPSMEWIPQFNLVESIVWSVALLAPIATFLALPRLLPLRREIAWSRVKLLWPLAWLAHRGDRSWQARLRAAWRRDVLDEHAEGTRAGDVVRDERLLQRTRAIGWIAAALSFGAWGTMASLALAEDGQYGGRIALTAVALALVTGWLARVAASGAALSAQALSLGRGGFARFGLGAMVGAGYGAIAGFAAGFAAVLLGVPILDALTWTSPTSHETMLGFTAIGVIGAFAGSLLGALLIAPLAVAARRRAS